MKFNFILSFLMPDLSKFRECIEPPILSEYSLQTEKQYIVLQRKRLMKLKLSLIFSWFIDHKKRYPNNEDSNYIRNSFTSPTFTKMLTSPTQNEITHKGSEIVHAKIKKKTQKLLYSII